LTCHDVVHSEALNIYANHITDACIKAAIVRAIDRAALAFLAGQNTSSQYAISHCSVMAYGTIATVLKQELSLLATTTGLEELKCGIPTTVPITHKSQQ